MRTEGRRHPAHGGYARGEEARSQIIAVAIGAFGLRGYEGTSTRSIADLAGVNTPALQYYFGGKPGLYHACAEHIAKIASAKLTPALRSARRALARNAEPGELLRELRTLLADILEMLLGSEESAPWALFLMREQAHPTAAFDVVYGTMEPVLKLCAALIGRITGRSADDPEVLIMALGLYGQVTSFRFSHEALLRTLGTRAVGKAELRQIKTVIARQVEAALADGADRRSGRE
ncbi:MAG: CerR family C-terminal domain-containing protein [Caulobacteraceae bacterium]